MSFSADFQFLMIACVELSETMQAGDVAIIEVPFMSDDRDNEFLNRLSWLRLTVRSAYRLSDSVRLIEKL
jgi:hypothetical protein